MVSDFHKQLKLEIKIKGFVVVVGFPSIVLNPEHTLMFVN